MCEPGVLALASLMISDEFWALCDCIVARRTDPTQMSTATPTGRHKPRVHWHGSVLLHNQSTLTFRLRLILDILGT